ncbi:MAG: helix-turn-helix transcriptional regulator [Pseudomonadota bacterium]
MDNENTAATATQYLADIKAATGWSQPQIARKLGVSQPTVYRILNGQGDCESSTWMAITALHKQVFQRRKSDGKAAKPADVQAGAPSNNSSADKQEPR